MSLTPMDISEQRFRRVWRGYAPQEVHHFLEKTAEEYRQLKQRLAEARLQQQSMQHELNDFRGREQIVREAMFTAQRAVEEQRAQAEQDAAAIRATAQQEAQEILVAAQERTVQLQTELNDLQRQRQRFIAEMHAILHSHMRLLDICEHNCPVVSEQAQLSALLLPQDGVRVES